MVQKKTLKKYKKIISEKKYKDLQSKKKTKKKMTSKEKKLLDKALYSKYCKCLKIFESKNQSKGYPICMNSIYKNRGFTPPYNASKKCKK